MSSFLGGFAALPPYGLAAFIVLILYIVQSEIRFGGKARSHAAGASDRGSSKVLSIAAVVPILGFVLAMKAPTSSWVPDLFRATPLPGMPAIAWVGVAASAIGVLVRLWAVLTLRERYTRTLLTYDEHAVERGGPYRWVRHPGYLGSLLVLNGLAMASGNTVALVGSLVATIAGYAYRIRVEDEMLVRAFGEAYEAYRREVGAVIPFVR
jgi:protein-S-isoprenylcysteine O-methyltransferase Ste14